MLGFGKKKEKEGDEEVGDNENAEEEEQKKEQEALANLPAGKKVVTMKEGDYLIHVHIQYCTNLILDEDPTCDPYIQVDCLGVSKSTKQKNDVAPTSKVEFDEHLYLELPKLTKEQVGDGVIIIQCSNKGFFSSQQIGQFDLSLSKVYNMKEHVMKDQMLGINCPDSEDFAKIRGYITVNVNVQGPGDEAVELKMGTQADIAKNPPLIPASVKKSYKQAHLRVFRGENLPKMDTDFTGKATSIDAYIKVEQQKHKLKTKVVKMENEVVIWNQEFLIPIELPLKNDKLVVSLWDSDYTYDSLAATIDISYEDLLKKQGQKSGGSKKGSTLEWFDMYGAHVGYSGKNTEMMNKDPHKASCWKGRILMEYWVEECKFPKFKVKDIQTKEAKALVDQKLADKRKYSLIIEFGSGICLPDFKDMELKFVWGKREFKSGKAKQQKRIVGAKASNVDYFYRWDTRFQEIEFEETIDEISHFPYFFIYLMFGTKQICYVKKECSEFLNPEGPVTWFILDPDPSVGKVTSKSQCGMISMRLYFHDHLKNGDIRPLLWKKPPPERLGSHKFRASIYQAESLPPADSNGTSDPFCELWTSKAKIKTFHCEDTNNPIWYKVLDFDMEFNDIKNAPPIILNIYDYDDDLMDATDDLIGRSVIWLKDMVNKKQERDERGLPIGLSESDDIPYPKWWPVTRNFGDPYDEENGAAILVSFQMVRHDQEWRLPADQIELHKPADPLIFKMPNLMFTDFKCEITALALKSLISAGLLPVNKAYIKFNVKSLLPPANAKAVQNIQTQPNACGPDPCLRTTIQFEVQMPSDPNFCARMQCDVFDNLYMAGLAQPHVGTFTLDIGEFIQIIQNKDEDMIKELKKTIKQLEFVKKKLINTAPGLTSPREILQGEAIVFDSATSVQDQVQNATTIIGLKILNQIKEAKLQLPPSKANGKSTSRTTKRQDGKVNQEGQASQRSIASQHDKTVNEEEVQLLLKAPNPEDNMEQLKKLLGADYKKLIQKAHEAKIATEKAEEEKQRKAAQKEMAKIDKDAYNEVVMPKIIFDDRLRCDKEHQFPPKNLFMPVGYLDKPILVETVTELTDFSHAKKHYRRYFPDELENIKVLGEPLIKSPFITEELVRAKAEPSGGLFGSLFGGGNNANFITYKTGIFKGLVRCYSPEIRKKAQRLIKENAGKVLQLLRDMMKIQNIKKQLILKDPMFDPEYKFAKEEAEDAIKNAEEILWELTLGHLNLQNLFGDLIYEGLFMSKLNNITVCIVRCYVLEGFNFAQKDLFSASDPYIVVKLGNTIHSEEKNYQLDTNAPKIYKCFEFVAEFPGTPFLNIKAYDYDDFFPHDLIGESDIDLDDRFYSQSWQSFTYKPIEFRDLFHKTSTVTQGVIKCWVDIIPKAGSAASLPAWHITQDPGNEMIVQVVIWKTTEIEAQDFEGTSDVYLRAYFNASQDQFTDIHWRSSTGDASFNWRCLIPLQTDRDQYMLNVQAWDKDIIKCDDIIGDIAFDVTPLVKDVEITGRKMVLQKEYWDTYMKGQLQQSNESYLDQIEFDDDDKSKFWAPIRTQKDGVMVAAGKVMLSITVMPKTIHEKDPQGLGRAEKNSDPFCPEPEGRIKFSLNPFDMLSQLIPAAMWRKIFCALCCAFCCFLCIMMFPQILSNLLTMAIQKMFGG